MSQEGKPSERLKEATEALEAEQRIWMEQQMTHEPWRMGNSEFYFACQLITMAKIIKDKLGISDDEFTAELRTVTCEELIKLRESIEKSRREALQEELTKGIDIVLPPDYRGNMN